MDLLTTSILMGLGATALVGTSTYLLSKENVEIEELNNRFKEIDKQIKVNDNAIKKYSAIKNKIQNAIEYLDDGKKCFANGGHVFEETPLANIEFINTNKKLNQAITNINNINKKLNRNIEILQKEIIQINDKIAKMNK